MKVLAVVCSHAGARSHTAALCRKLFEALNENVFHGKAELECITLDQLNIGFCRSCDHCFSWGSCPLAGQDDVGVLREKILSCDLLMMGSPVYVAAVSGSYKNLIDRLSLWCHTMSLAGKLCIPVSTTSGNNLYAATNAITDDMRRFGCIVLPPVCAFVDVGKPRLSDEEQMRSVFDQCCGNAASALEDRIRFVDDLSRRSFQAFRTRYRIIGEKLGLLGLKTRGEVEIWEQSGFGSFESFDELCRFRIKGGNHVDAE